MAIIKFIITLKYNYVNKIHYYQIIKFQIKSDVGIFKH